MKCICKNMKEAGLDRDLIRHKSENYDGFVFCEIYGRWYLQEDKFAGNGIEIFYCPLCGRKLNHWWFAKDDRKAILKNVFKR